MSAGAAAGTGTVKVFLLPDLGEGLTEAEIVSWWVGVGDRVEVDQIIAVVETAKAAVDLPCPYAGTVVALHGEPGDVIDVGTPFISVDVGGPDDAPDAQPPTEQGSGNVLIGYGTTAAPARRRRTASEPAAAAARDADEVPSRPGGRVRVISPLVRRIAAEHGIDLRTLTPSGPKGIILRADVEAAIAGRGAAPDAPTDEPTAEPTAGPGPQQGTQQGTAAPGTGSPSYPPAPDDVTVPMTLTQRAAAERLTTSRREVPDATTWVDVDATGLLELRAELAASWPDARIGVLALVGRIVVAGLRRHPELNARVNLDPGGAPGTLTRFGQVHLSFAAQGPRGLVVPVVHDAGSMNTAQLAAALRDLTDRARAGTLSPAELTGGTFTVNNYGGYGVDGSTPILNHPEAGMLGLGRIVDKPWVVEGRLAVRKVTQLSLTFDHRVCDGAVAGGFLRFVADCVERPALLLGAL